MSLLLLDPDILFFREHRDRQVRIRPAVGNEEDAAFKSLGPHNIDRRRIIVLRVPNDARMAAGKLMKIPYLLFDDTTVEDTDEILLPLVHQVMMEAAKGYNIHPPKRR
jgi:hypothetical protein